MGPLRRPTVGSGRTHSALSDSTPMQFTASAFLGALPRLQAALQRPTVGVILGG